MVSLGAGFAGKLWQLASSGLDDDFSSVQRYPKYPASKTGAPTVGSFLSILEKAKKHWRNTILI